MPQPTLAELAHEAVAAGPETESAPPPVPVSWEQDVAFELEPAPAEPITSVSDGAQRLEPPATIQGAAAEPAPAVSEDAVMPDVVAEAAAVSEPEVADSEVMPDVVAEAAVSKDLAANEAIERPMAPPSPLLVETSVEQDVAAELPESSQNELDPDAAIRAPTGTRPASPPHAATEPEGEHVEPKVEAMPARGPITPIGATLVRGRSIAPTGDRLAAEADGPSLAGRKAQFDLLGLEDPGRGTVAPAQPVSLPYRSSGAGPHRSEREARGRGGEAETIWDASARQVAEGISAVAIQSCDSCGLSLSASARFCRRCGSPQTRSA